MVFWEAISDLLSRPPSKRELAMQNKASGKLVFFMWQERECRKFKHFEPWYGFHTRPGQQFEFRDEFGKMEVRQQHPPDHRAVFWSCGWTVIMSLVEWNGREKRLPESSVGHLRDWFTCHTKGQVQDLSSSRSLKCSFFTLEVGQWLRISGLETYFCLLSCSLFNAWPTTRHQANVILLSFDQIL